MDKKLTVGVMFGGKSPEHEVSVITGIQVIENIDREKYNPVPIYIGKNGNWHIGDTRLNQIETYRDLNRIEKELSTTIISPNPNEKQIIDVLFLCFHGGSGENGAVQGLLDLTEIPYTCAGTLGSAIGFDKIVMKNIFSDNRIPITKYFWFFRDEFNKNQKNVIQKIEQKLKYPLFVKPANAGSSIGITKSHNQKELINAIEVACFYDRKIVVEESFKNAKEINISIIGNSGGELMCSVCEQVVASGEILTYDDKYKGGNDKTGKSKGMASTKRIIPAPLKPETVSTIQEIAKKAYESLDLMGLARLDFMVREDTNEIVILEANTIPGSMSFYLWEATGLKFKDMISKLIDLAISRKEDEKKNITSFESNILQNFKTGIKGK